MSMQTVRISCGSEVPQEWGIPHAAKRKTTVSRREPNGVETFHLAWGSLIARPGEDWVLLQDSGEAYPIKKSIFDKTYEELAPGRYRKSAHSRLIQVPEGVTAMLATKEGDVEVRHPDYVVIGVEGEVYANSADWVAENLEFVN